MNFQTVAQNNGNLVSMLATVIELGNQKLNVNQKPIQSVKLRDDNGEQHSVTINKGNGQLLGATALGQRLSFNLSTYDGQHGIGYSGFWNSRAQVRQPNQQSPQQGRQAPPRAPQQPNNKQRDYDAENRGKCRTQFIKAAIIAGGLRCNSYQDVLALTEFAMTGIDVENIPEPDESIAEPPL